MFKKLEHFILWTYDTLDYVTRSRVLMSASSLEPIAQNVLDENFSNQK